MKNNLRQFRYESEGRVDYIWSISEEDAMFILTNNNVYPNSIIEVDWEDLHENKEQKPGAPDEDGHGRVALAAETSPGT
jgi:hypothetical protein